MSWFLSDTYPFTKAVRQGRGEEGAFNVSFATASMLICPSLLSQLASAYSVPSEPPSKLKWLTCIVPLTEGLSKRWATWALPEAYPPKLTEWKLTKSRIYSTLTFFKSTVSESSLPLVTMPLTVICCSPLVMANWSISRWCALYLTLAGWIVSTVSPMLTCEGNTSMLATALPSVLCVKLILAFRRPRRRCFRAWLSTESIVNSLLFPADASIR